MLVEHLALELNEKISGKVFINQNKNKIDENINNSVDSHKKWFWIDESSDIEVDGLKIKDENDKKYIRETEETGKAAKNEFLNNLNINGLEK